MTEPKIAARERDKHVRAAGLANLGDLDDYEVADGEPDVRGWDVTTDDEQRTGLGGAPAFPKAPPTEVDQRDIDAYFANSSPSTRGYVASLRTATRGQRP